MTGDWVVDTIRDTLPAHARAFLAFEHGKRLVLDDPRALSVLHVLPPEAVLSGSLGPDAMEKAFDAAHLASTLAKRRGAIKTVLLDQRVVAGLGNIYVAEALWLARIDPRRAANRLTASRLAMLVKAIRRVLAKALRHAGRYYESGGGGGGGGGGGWSSRFAVYDREGAPCKRCGARIKRIAQGGRSTYFCARCQT
jgi:formamidopyrimidine-DNA glycosylase